MALSEVSGGRPRRELAVLSPVEVVAKAPAHRLNVFTVGERLVVRGLANADSGLVDVLLRRKAELMPLLVLDADEREYFEERAGIAEYDGGLSRCEAEWLAWEEVWANRRSNHAGPG